MILERLKAETAENHRLLENSGLMSPLLQDTITIEHYKKILLTFYGYFAPLEASILNQKDLHVYLPDLNERRKTERILDDLQSLSSQKIPSPELSKKIPEIKTLNQAFGCLYVMEGSTLGGSVIYKSLNKHLGLTHDNGCSFFYGYGSSTGSTWKLFQNSLIHYSTLPEANTDHIVKAANDCFFGFREWIMQRPE
ncbi:MAG: biliverdin-producing heme oxygenase [Cytophagaceae bacterium]